MLNSQIQMLSCLPPFTHNPPPSTSSPTWSRYSILSSTRRWEGCISYDSCFCLCSNIASPSLPLPYASLSSLLSLSLLVVLCRPLAAAERGCVTSLEEGWSGEVKMGRRQRGKGAGTFLFSPSDRARVAVCAHRLGLSRCRSIDAAAAALAAIVRSVGRRVRRRSGAAGKERTSGYMSRCRFFPPGASHLLPSAAALAPGPGGAVESSRRWAHFADAARPHPHDVLPVIDPCAVQIRGS